MFHWRFFHHHPHIIINKIDADFSLNLRLTLSWGLDFSSILFIYHPWAAVNTQLRVPKMVIFAEFGGLHPVESSKTDADFSLKLQLTLSWRLEFSSIIIRICSKIITIKQTNKQKYNTNDHIMGLGGENKYFIFREEDTSWGELSSGIFYMQIMQSFMHLVKRFVDSHVKPQEYGLYVWGEGGSRMVVKCQTSILGH